MSKELKSILDWKPTKFDDGTEGIWASINGVGPVNDDVIAVLMAKYGSVCYNGWDFENSSELWWIHFYLLKNEHAIEAASNCPDVEGKKLPKNILDKIKASRERRK